MKIFSRKPNSHRLNGPLPIDPETGLYSQNFFLLRLKEERERTKRNGSAFSLLIVDVEGISTALNEKSGTSSRTQKSLVRWLVRQSRKTDTKGWFDLKRVGILMPDTKTSGALEFKEKIYNQFRQEWPGGEKLYIEQSLLFRGFSFGFSDEVHAAGESH